MSISESANGRRFVYRGNAVPLGGQIGRIRDKRVSKLITSPAASSLSVVGGESHSKGAASKFEDIFSWGESRADSTGVIGAKGYPVTTVTARIEKVSATNKPITFASDLLSVTVVSEHPTQGQPSIVPTEAIFYKKQMTFNNMTVLFDLDLDVFQKLSTLESLDREFKTNKRFFDRFRNRFKRVRIDPPTFGSCIPRVSGYVSCSIVSGLTWGDKKISGNVLQHDHFGRIHFGELLINEYNRRLTLVRLQMGCDVQADLGLAEVDPNGIWN